MDGQIYDELIEEVLCDFSALKVSRFLQEVGLSNTIRTYMEESFGNLIFLHGDENEVYSESERRFIESVGSIIVFSDFYKKTQNGNIPCRILAVDISDYSDAIYASVLLMKIVNKALSGFNIFLIKATTGLHIGLKLYDKSGSKNCTISEQVTTVPLLFEEVRSDESEDFLEFYNMLVDVFQPREQGVIDYDQLVTKKRGVQEEYLDMLIEIETLYRESTRREKDRYMAFFEETAEVSFATKLNDCVEDLRNIKSSKINTIEMLFEAEVAEQLATETEEKQGKFLDEPESNVQKDVIMIEQFRNDPEAMINMLKKKKGLW